MTSFLKTLFLRLCASLRPYAVIASTHVRLQYALVSQWLYGLLLRTIRRCARHSYPAFVAAYAVVSPALWCVLVFRGALEAAKDSKDSWLSPQDWRETFRRQ